MRNKALMVLHLALTLSVLSGKAACASQGGDQDMLPAGGIDVMAAGLSFHAPGAPWRYAGYSDTLAGFSRGGEAAGFEIRSTDSWIGLEVRPYSWIGKWNRDRSPGENLVAEFSLWASFEGGHEPAFLRRLSQPRMSTVTVNGASCVEWDATLEPRKSNRPMPARAVQHGLLCSHPEFPGFAVEMTATQHGVPGGQSASIEADREAFFRSLRFTPLGYRVRELALKGRPWTFETTDGALWAIDTAASNSCDNGMEAVRIDPQTGHVVARVPVGHACNLIADAHGVWALDAKDQLMFIDPKVNQVSNALKIPHGVTHVAAGGGYLWMTTADPGRLVRVDPVTGATLNVDGVTKDPDQVAARGNTVFVSDFYQDGILVVDSENGRIVRKLNAPHGVFALRSFDSFLWSVQLDVLPSSVLRIDPANPESAPTPFGDLAPYRPLELAWWNGRLIVLGSNALGLIDPTRHTVELLPLPGGDSNDVIAAGGSLWVAGPQSVLRIDPK